MNFLKVFITVLLFTVVLDGSCFGADDYPTFLNAGHSFTCRSIKASSSTSFEKSSSRHSLSLTGYYHIPLQSTKDIVAADIESFDPVVVDRAGKNLLVKARPLKKRAAVYCPVHDIGKGGETANKPINLKYDLSDEAANIDHLAFSINVLEVQKRKLVDREPLVSEEYTEVVSGLFVRISNLSLKTNREFTVVLNYKRSSKGLDAPFFEGVQVLDVNGEVIGGGRWTYGNPIDLEGKFTAKFKLVSPDMHHMIRLVIVTEANVIPVQFQLSRIFDQ